MLQTRWPRGWSSRGSGSAALLGARRAWVRLHFPSEVPVSWRMTDEPLPVPSATRFLRGYEMKRAHTQSPALPGSAGALPSTRIWRRWAPKAAAARELCARQLHQSLPPHTGGLATRVLTPNLPPASPPFTGAQLASATALFSPSQARECQAGRHSWPVPRSGLARPPLWPSSPRTPSKGWLGYGFKLGRAK